MPHETDDYYRSYKPKHYQGVKCESCGKVFDVTEGMGAAVDHRDKEGHHRFTVDKEYKSDRSES